MQILSGLLRKPEKRHWSLDSSSLTQKRSNSPAYSRKSLPVPSDAANVPPFSLSIRIESPPIVFYGIPSESSGSILSGLVRLHVGRPKGSILPLQLQHSLRPVSSAPTIGDRPLPHVTLNSVSLSLVQTVHYDKSFMISSSACTLCPDCCTRKITVALWNVLTSPVSFEAGSHAYPFSQLLPGTLSQSCKLGHLLLVSYIMYDLVAVAVCAKTGKSTTVLVPINVARLIIRGPDRNSVRIFPPTEISANVVLPSVVHPKSAFTVDFKLENVALLRRTRRWRLRKLSWRIDETTRVRAYACERHVPKLKAASLAYKRQKPGDASGSTATKNSSQHHHSTVHSRMMLWPYPASYASHPALSTSNSASYTSHPTSSTSHPASYTSHADPQLHNADDLVSPDAAAAGDLSGSVESRPSRAHQNFVLDFLTPQRHHRLQDVLGAGLPPAAEADPPASPPSRPADTAASCPASNANGAAHPDLFSEETRTVSHGEIKQGWKSDFSENGLIELVANISVANLSTGFVNHISSRSSNDVIATSNKEGLRHDANFACDIDDPELGIFVSHSFVVEVVVAEEITRSVEKNCPNINPELPVIAGIPLGLARVLRMQFKLIMTERSGLGIAWDDEVPPTYNDIRSFSPPNYHASSPQAQEMATTETVDDIIL